MVVLRWQAAVVPTIEQMKIMMQSEGLTPVEEIFLGQSKVKEHRHPFDEVRMVVSGELLFNVSGNQLLLRPGDKIMIPSNTKHELSVQGEHPCVSICAMRPF